MPAFPVPVETQWLPDTEGADAGGGAQHGTPEQPELQLIRALQLTAPFDPVLLCRFCPAVQVEKRPGIFCIFMITILLQHMTVHDGLQGVPR
ncbi:hypothetical protein ACFS6H_13695 [Terrimonas rubra]|uniref:Uncharacterized protein n=1 Tax=Terrimonas rubra TaxID=1035890 RepID=A0ABW6A627_9BACT